MCAVLHVNSQDDIKTQMTERPCTLKLRFSVTLHGFVCGHTFPLPGIKTRTLIPGTGCVGKVVHAWRCKFAWKEEVLSILERWSKSCWIILGRRNLRFEPLHDFFLNHHESNTEYVWLVFSGRRKLIASWLFAVWKFLVCTAIWGL